MRMIVTFEKGFALRYIGHLDLMRAMQRALRRSDLPLQYSKGFNPHINLSFAYPLSVGVVGCRELMDVPIESEIAPEAFAERLQRTLPSCIKVLGCQTVEDSYPTLMSLVAGSKITIRVQESVQNAAKLAVALDSFMKSDECIALRKTKSGEAMCNIRPFVLEADCEPTDNGCNIHCVMLNNKNGALKPTVLMKALCDAAGLNDVFFIAYREAILARDQDGKLIPMEQYHV